MAMSGRTKNVLAEALADSAAATEIATLVAAATGGVGVNPSVTTLATSGGATIGGAAVVSGASTLTGNVAASGTLNVTGAATIGGTCTHNDHLLLASGKVLKVNSVQVVGAQQTAVTPVAVTFSANAPATYASPTGALTVSDGATPTVVELVKYCNELRKNILDLQAVLHAHGLTT